MLNFKLQIIGQFQIIIQLPLLGTHHTSGTKLSPLQSSHCILSIALILHKRKQKVREGLSAQCHIAGGGYSHHAGRQSGPSAHALGGVRRHAPEGLASGLAPGWFFAIQLGSRGSQVGDGLGEEASVSGDSVAVSALMISRKGRAGSREAEG